MNLGSSEHFMENLASSSSSKRQVYVDKTYYIVNAVFSGLIALFCLFQLIRIHVRLWQLRHQSRRLNFLAKRLFHVFLGLSFIVKFANDIFELESFCFADPYRAEAWWCFPVDVFFRRLSSFLMFSAYLITLLFWTEFVYCIKYNAATGEYFVKYKKYVVAVAIAISAFFVVFVISVFACHDVVGKDYVNGKCQVAVDTVCMYVIGVAFCAAGIGIIWKGFNVVKYAKELHSGNKNATVIKLFVLICICSFLLLFRSLWAMIAFPVIQFKFKKESVATRWILYIVGELLPSLAMLTLMYPLPARPVKFASKRVQAEYHIIKVKE